jgi:hypothetical protein
LSENYICTSGPACPCGPVEGMAIHFQLDPSR